jgi:hypothetical protein
LHFKKGIGGSEMNVSLRRVLLHSFLFLGIGGGMAVPAAHAESGGDALTIDLEIAEKGGNNPADALSSTLSLVGEHGCASVETHRGMVAYDIDICREGGDSATPILKFTISRNESFPPASPSAPSAAVSQGISHQKFKLTSKLKLGQKTVLGTLNYNDGMKTHLTATLR